MSFWEVREASGGPLQPPSPAFFARQANGAEAGTKPAVEVVGIMLPRKEREMRLKDAPGRF